ncbi:MAG: TetR/AcrR family transcriptional regulator [Halofilum sp. (in: g-proteobacteria)]
MSKPEKPAGSRAVARQPGRPRGDSQLRDRLLEAALAEFAEHGFGGASMRRIAQAAGATPAMAHYYFGDKRGLYRAILEHTLAPALAEIRGQTQEALEGGDPIARFVRAFMRRLAGEPGIAAVLARDLLTPDSEIREVLIRGSGRSGADAVRGIIRHEIGCGRLRRDLDPELAALSLLSLCAFPFLAPPVAGHVLDEPPTPEQVERLATHTLALFFQGAEVRP